MKYNSKKFLALLLSVQMAVSPVCVYAQDLDKAVETELVTEAVTEVVTETATEAVTEAATETATEVATEVVTEAATETATEAATETGTEETTEAGTEEVTEDTTETAETAGETLPEETVEEATEAVTEETAEEVTEEATECFTEIETEIVAEDTSLMATDGTTTEVDNSTTLKDGVYAADAIKVTKASDGTNPKSAFTCKKLTVKDGKVEATIEIASGSYTYIKANAQTYNCECTDSTSTATFPVALNVENDIIGYTTAMSTGVEVAYKLLIELDETTATEMSTESEEVTEEATEEETEAETEVYVPNYYDGDYKIDISCDFGMVGVTGATAVVSDGVITVTVSTNRTTYDRLYLGSVDDAEETKEANAIVGVSNGAGYDFTFELPKSMMGQQVPISPCKYDGTWYVKKQYYLTIPTALDYTDGKYDIGVECDFSMVGVTASSAIVSGGEIIVTVNTNRTTYDRLYLGSIEDDEATKEANAIVGVSNGVGYDFTFTLSKSMMGQKVPISPCKYDGTWYVKKQYYLTIPEVMEKISSSYASGDYNLSVESDNAAFVITDASASVVNGEINVVIKTEQSSYDRIFFGSVSAASKTADVTGTADENGYYSFSFTLDDSQIGQNVAFVPGNADGWYTDEQCYLIIPADMVKTQDVVKTSNGLIYQRQYYKVDGGYEAVFTETYPMSNWSFVNFNGIYQMYYMEKGSYDLVEGGFFPVIDNGDGTYCIRFFLSDEYLEQNDDRFTYLVQYADGTWYSYTATDVWSSDDISDATPSIQPQVSGNNKTVPEYDDGVYSAAAQVYLTSGNEYVLSNFTVDDCEITVSGDEITVVIRNNSSAYDRLYIGEASDADKSAYVTKTVDETNEDAPYTYTFTLPKSSLCSEVSFVPGNFETDFWSARTWTLILPYTMELIESTETETETETEGSSDATLDDGEYTVGSVVTGESMFKVVDTVLTVENGAMTALVTLSGTGYDYLYMGSAEDAVNDTENWIAAKDTVEYTDANGNTKTGARFEIPVSALDTPIAVASHAIKSGDWIDRTMTFESSSVEKVEEELENGDYSVSVETGAAMFKVIDAVLTNNDGVMTALITLSGTGSNYIYMGTAENAVNDEANWIGIKDTVEYTDANGNVKTGARFEIPVSALDTPITAASRGTSSGTWTNRTLTFNSSTLEKIEDSSETETDATETETDAAETETDTTETETDPVETETNAPEADDSTAAVDNSTTLADGTYVPESFTFSGGSGKTQITCTKITVEDGKAYATIQFSSSSYDYVKASAGKYTNLTPGKNSTFVISIALNQDNIVIGNTTAMSTAKEIEYTIHAVLSETAETFDIKETEAETEKQTEKQTEAGEAVDPSKLQNGDYSVTVDDSQAKMFNVVSCVLTYKDGEMTAKIALSGQGYDAIYAGTKEEAAKAGKSDISLYYVNADGKYEFEIPVAALDTELTYAARSAKTGEWFDRVLIFTSAGMKLIDGTEETEKQTETETETEASTEADKESSYVTDLSGGTSAVDNSTTLADGVYTPDKFSWSGGSGRASITCAKITVTNGQAYATIVFNSESYAYLKANGNKYTGTKGGGTTTFVIPVKLNANNTIIGMTTAMSAAHEITYTIYIYLAAADAASSGADGEAPVIAGLTYEDEVEMEYADYLRIYNYSDGIKLIEIDMVSDTLRETESEAAEEETEALPEEEMAAEETAEEAAEDVEVSEDEEEVVQTAEEIIAELYLEDVVRYLVVPEDVEIPVGLEKEMIIVNVPVESAYIASEEAMLMMEDLDVLDLIAASGFEAEECPCEAVKEALETEGLVFAGTYEEPVFKEMVLNRIDIAVLPDEILVKEEETAEEDMERFEQITSGFGTLGIPMIVDRSSDEQTELAQAEWIKAYGILFGCEELADEIYAAVVEAQK